MGFIAWIWSEKLWLPEGYTWKDFESTKSIKKPQIEDLYVVLPLAVLLLVMRIIFERFIALRFCKYIGIKDVPRKMPEPNLILEQVFTKVTKRPDAERVTGLSKQLGWSEYQVNLWFARKKNELKPAIMRKSTETCWRLLFYSVAFIYGFVVLSKKPWAYDSDQWQTGYIREQNLDYDIQYYYMIELAFYVSLLFSLVVDNKRKDFWEMTIHHVATINLFATSYIAGYFRQGAIVIAIHDAADCWLESAKLTNYAKMQKLCDFLFVVFTLVFYITRLIIYPCWVLKTAIFTTPRILGVYPSHMWAIGICCLLLLQVLHIFWSITIGKIVYNSIFAGKVERDIRSDDEEPSGDEKEENNVNSKKKI